MAMGFSAILSLFAVKPTVNVNGFQQPNLMRRWMRVKGTGVDAGWKYLFFEFVCVQKPLIID
jgi:hypothetical protein